MTASASSTASSPRRLGDNTHGPALYPAYTSVAGEQVAEDRVAAAAAQCVAEHENVAAAQPGQRNSGEFPAKALFIIEVVAEIQFGGVESQFTERSGGPILAVLARATG
jgi:hypothetical protein